MRATHFYSNNNRYWTELYQHCVLSEQARGQAEAMVSYAFTVPVLPGVARTVSRRTHDVGRTCSPRAMAQGWESPTEWKTAGSGVGSKGMQRIEFIIRQDGTVEERVTGVRGKDCVEVSFA